MAKKQDVLGRGLDALLPSGKWHSIDELLGPAPGGIYAIKVDRIVANARQPRQSFDEEGLQGLTRSVAALGIIQPVTVRATSGGHFEVIAGERRLRAARRAGLDTVPAFVRVANDEEMLAMALVENVQREALNPIEVALGYQRLVAECGMRQEEVAARVGRTRSTVANFLRLLKLPERIQVALRERVVSVGHARALLGLNDRAAQLRLFEAIVAKGLSVRAVEALVKKHSKQPKRPVKPPPPSRTALQLKAVEKSLRGRFATRVKVTSDASGKGRIELHYYSNDEFERVLELLLQDPR